MQNLFTFAELKFIQIVTVLKQKHLLRERGKVYFLHTLSDRIVLDGIDMMEREFLLIEDSILTKTHAKLFIFVLG